MELRDPIYGLIEYDKKEEKLINTPLFQRLRGVKQLALANLVYPGAHHTRFEHCIGTMHLAGRIAKAKKLNLNEEKINILRLAGLLHDIGHGPFSHVSEQIMENRTDKEILDKYEAQNAHELMSILLIQKNKEIAEILSQEEIEEIVLLLQKRRNIEKDIVSGPLDADKLDYLLRDSYFAGVQYGVFDLDKIIESLTPIKIGTKETQLGISEEGIYAAEQMLLAKYHMNTQVYRHRIRRITDAMLIRGVEFAIEEIEEIKNLYTCQDTDDFLEEYVKYDDKSLVDKILANCNGTSLEYFERLKKRKLLKEVLSVEINEVNFPDSILLQNIRTMSEGQMIAIRDKAAELFATSEHKIDSNLVIVDKQTTHNPTFKLPQVRIDTGTIMVVMRDGRTKTFPEISAIFSTAVVPEKDTLYVYLPLDRIERKDRKNAIEGNKKALLEIVKEEVK
jgi:HD superfamily phosphohydrolase